MELAITILLWFSALTAGLMAGIYYAFSGFIMRALAQMEPPGGMLAMRAINRTIMRSLFIPLFLASTAACLFLAAYGLLYADEPGTLPMALGAALYILGMALVTMRANVPLNNILEAAEPTAPGATPIWQRYLTRWTAWNHVRTLACLGALGLFVVAIAERW